MNLKRALLISLAFLSMGSTYCLAQVKVVDTIFIADYENNQTNSGYVDLNPTNAPAAYAVYMVTGNNSNYAVAHKVDRTDSTYFSNGAFRSESDVLDFSVANYFPGDHRRYEFSLYLKDWEEYTPGAAPYGNNLFQLKETSGVTTRIATKRNGLFVWEPRSSQNELINDIRPYINEWIDFRIDVLWTKDTTGYINYYIRFPEETSYTLVRSVENTITYFGTATGGQRGYVKWGVYREENPESINTPVTRIAYHDNIKLFDLDFSPDFIIDNECIAIFPNQRSGYLNIQGDLENYSIQILDSNGGVFIDLSTVSDSVNIDINSLPSGLYFVQIINQQNNNLFLEQIIKM